jgi:hypothetical protein
MAGSVLDKRNTFRYSRRTPNRNAFRKADVELTVTVTVNATAK